MFGKKYSQEKLTLFVSLLVKTDKYYKYPDYIPSLREVKPKSFELLLGKNKRKKDALVQRYAAFNYGVIFSLGEHYFDGDQKYFEGFIDEALKLAHGKIIAKFLNSANQKYKYNPNFFQKGYEFGKTILEKERNNPIITEEEKEILIEKQKQVRGLKEESSKPVSIWKFIGDVFLFIVYSCILLVILGFLLSLF